MQWTGERKEKDPTIQALVAGAKAAWVGGKKVKGVGENDPREAVLRAFESQGDRTVLLTCSALVCPTCLSNGLKFARFSALGY